jgi:hypothetical protein
MGQEYFGDVLDSSDKRMDFDYEDVFKMDALKLLTFKAKSAPSKGVNLSQGTDMVSGKNNGYDFKHKSEIKVAHENDLETKVTVSNKDFKLEAEWQPADLNKDMHFSAEVESKIVPAKSEWEAKLEVKAGGMEVGPMRPWTELQFDTNQAKEHTLTFSQNLQMDDFHVGYNLVGDVNNSSLSKAWAQLAWRNSGFGDIYMRANKARFVGLGWSASTPCGNASVSTEA